MVVPLWLARFRRREWLVLAADAHFLGAGCSRAWRCVTPQGSYFNGNSDSGDIFTTNTAKQRHSEYYWQRCGSHAIEETEEYTVPAQNIDDSPKALTRLSKVQPVPVEQTVVNHRRVLSAQKLFLQNMRHFSTKSDTDLEHTKSFHELGPGDTTDFIDHVDAAAKELSTELEIELLKAEFNREIRPLLAVHCLMLPSNMGDDIAFLHGAVHGISKANVLYVSSLDIMLRLKCLKEPEKKPLIDYIIHRRVMVADTWSRTYGNIELLQYNFRETNTNFVRGECDATFKKQIQSSGQALGAQTKKGIAKLAFVIWKEKQLIWAEILKDVPCQDNDFAEVLAALALLRKCEEKNFSLVELWSDNARACGVITGSQTIKMADSERGTCLLLRSMPTKFDQLVTVQKPRELMFFTDQLLRMDGYSGCIVRKAIEIWLSKLKGFPLFRVTNNKMTSDIIDTFAKKRTTMEANGFRYLPSTTFFLKVENGHKFEELQSLRQFLLPSCMHLVMDDFEEKSPILKKQLKDMFPEMNTFGRTTTFQDLVNVDLKKRNLVVVWDASIPRAHYYHKDSCIIIFAEAGEVEKIKNSGINEINVETFLYFNRAEYKKMT